MGQTITLNGSGTDPDQGDTLTYTWDLDNNGSFETAGQNPHFSAIGLQPGSQTVTLQVCDNHGACTTASTTVNVLTDLRIVTDSPLPSGTVGQNYSVTLIAAGGTQPYKWLVIGNLPQGLNLNQDTGQISGTPTTAGTFAFNIQVTDSSLLTATKQFNFSPPPSNGTGGTPYTLPVDPSGGGGTTAPSCTSGSYQVVGGNAQLPPGLTIDPNIGIISGTPTNGGSYSFTVACVVSGGQTATKDFTITIYNPQPMITTLNPASTLAGGPTFTLVVNGNNFVQSSKIRWNGSDRTTNYISINQLTALINASDITIPGSAEVTVFNPDPAGGTSNTVTFTIAAPNHPPTANAGGPYNVIVGQVITLNGSGFDPDQGDTLSYAWDLDNNGSFETAGQNASFSAAGFNSGNQTVTLRVCDNHGACTTATTTVNVLMANTSLITEAANGSYGGKIDLKATLTAYDTGLSGKTISFKLNGQTVCGLSNQPTCPVTDANGLATLAQVSLAGIDVGTYNPGPTSGVSASFAGDSQYVANTGSNSFTVNPADTSVALISSVTNPVFGQDISFTATVTGAGTPTGSVVFYLDGAAQPPSNLSLGVASFFPTDNLTVGSHQLKATYSGNANFNGSDAPNLNLTISKANTSLNLIADINPATRGQDVVFTAQLNVVVPGDGTPSGSIAFYLDNVLVSSAVPLDADGTAAYTYTNVTTGTHIIKAVYSGDSSFATTNSQLTEVVNNPATGLTVKNVKAKYGSNVTLSATLAAGGVLLKGKTITFSINGTAVCGGSGQPACPTTNTNGTANLTKVSLGTLLPGTYPITASFAGDSQYAASSGNATLTITKLTAKVTLSNLTYTYDGGAKYATVTTIPANLAVSVTYTQGGRVITSPTNAGKYKVTVTVTDPIYTGSASGTLTINKATVTLTFGNLTQTYDGMPKKVSVSSNPAGLESSVTVIYNGSRTPPTSPGSYSVIANLVNQNYTAADITATLVIQGISPSVTTGVAGKIRPTSTTLNGTVNANYATITAIYFNWGISTNALTNRLDVTTQVTGGTTKTVSGNLSGLPTKTTYYYQLVVEYNIGSSTLIVGGQTNSFVTT